MKAFIFIPAVCLLSSLISVLLSSGANALKWDPYAELACPETWDAPKPGQAFMFSGTDPGGKNWDSGNFLRIEPEGATFVEGEWVLAEMEGPGSITRIQMTGKNHANEAPRLFGRIKIYIDSKDTPVVDLPLESIYGRTRPFVPPLATTTSGSYICYLPIPFSRYCKVVVTDTKDQFAHRVNGLGQTIPHLYYQICWRKAPAGTEVEPFTMELSKTRQKLVNQAIAKFYQLPAATDFRSVTIAPGDKAEVFAAEGKGKVEELSLVSQKLDNLSISAHWDGSDEPAVDAPAWTFFAAGLEPRPFNSLALFSDGEVYSCRFPMPFSKGARIYVKNTGDRKVRVRVATKVSSQAPSSPLRFHARAIDEHATAGTPDLTLLDATNGPGHYVGTVMCLPMNFLEGNESISVDGGKPGWVGTGTEDHFNGGWYFCFGPYDYPLSGCIHLGEFTTAYRYHLTDAAPFARSIKVTLQHGGENEIEGRARGVAFWYGTDR